MLLSACGDNGTAAGNEPARVRETSYVTIEPETTTTTIAAAATTAPPGGAIDPNEQVYVIASGDSVSKIAGAYGITMDQLVQYNQWTDGINHLLVPGTEIKIPPNSKVPGTGTEAPAGGAGTSTDSVPLTTEPAGEPCTHTIEAGDTPTRVAEDYGITVQILQQANAASGVMTNFIVGDELIIPADAEGC